MSTPSVQTGYRFSMVPEWVGFHPDLDALQVRIYVVLDRHGRTPDRCYPSHAVIAKACKVSERSVGRPIARMAELGVLAIVPRYVRGRRSSNGYLLAGDQPLPTTAHTSAVGGAALPRSTARDYRAPQRGEREPSNETSNQVVDDTQEGAAAARAALRSNRHHTQGER